MLYSINLNNIKKSAQAVSVFLKDKGINLPRHLSLEVVARLLFIKNYNTLEALATSPRVIEHYEPEYKYLFEITINCEREKLLSVLKASFEKANASLYLTNFLQKDNDYHFEVDISKSDTNILTAIFILCETFKQSSYQISRFDYCRISCEKQSVMEYFKKQEPLIPVNKKNKVSDGINYQFTNVKEKVPGDYYYVKDTGYLYFINKYKAEKFEYIGQYKSKSALKKKIKAVLDKSVNEDLSQMKVGNEPVNSDFMQHRFDSSAPGDHVSVPNMNKEQYQNYVKNLENNPRNLFNEIKEGFDELKTNRSVSIEPNKNKPYAKSVSYLEKARTLLILFTDGYAYHLKVDRIKEFKGLSTEDFNNIQVTFAGTALTLKSHDLDISIQGLMKENNQSKYLGTPLEENLGLPSVSRDAVIEHSGKTFEKLEPDLRENNKLPKIKSKEDSEMSKIVSDEKRPKLSGKLDPSKSKAKPLSNKTLEEYCESIHKNFIKNN